MKKAVIFFLSILFIETNGYSQFAIQEGVKLEKVNLPSTRWIAIQEDIIYYCAGSSPLHKYHVPSDAITESISFSAEHDYPNVVFCTDNLVWILEYAGQELHA